MYSFILFYVTSATGCLPNCSLQIYINIWIHDVDNDDIIFYPKTNTKLSSFWLYFIVGCGCLRHISTHSLLVNTYRCPSDFGWLMFYQLQQKFTMLRKQRFMLRYVQHNQQDATLHIGIYYYKCSTCFRRFFRPSSGAQNFIHSVGCLSS
jgi:hypothetical protein